MTKHMIKKVVAGLIIAGIGVFSPIGAVIDENGCSIQMKIVQAEALAKVENTYEADGLRMSVPKKYKDSLLVSDAPNATKGMLFSVSEKASVEACKKAGQSDDGAGWLFGIGKVGEAKLHQLLCGDMSGAEIFAKDNMGNHYVYYHPTDVRYYRETTEQMTKDQDKWTQLNEWAWKSVREQFVKDNPGLIEEAFDNSTVAIYLYQILYNNRQNYTISTVQHGPLAPRGIDPSPYVRRLLDGATYEMVDSKDSPDGEYVVLGFPNESTRLDFFLQKGKENYVRCVVNDEGSILYRATFSDGKTRASEVMQEWYAALAADRGYLSIDYKPSPDWVKALPEAKTSKQMFVVAGVSTTTAWVSMHEKSWLGNWQQIMTTPAFIGAKGLGKEREGDGKTPVGTFKFNAAFGIAADPGCAIPYRQVDENFYWSGDGRPGMKYNELVDIRELPNLDKNSSEHLIEYNPHYTYCLNIGYNATCIPGKGSALFLHCFGPYKPYTGGCVAIPENKMRFVMRNVQPDCVVIINSMDNLGAAFS